MRDYLRQLKNVKLEPNVLLYDFFRTILIYLIATCFALCVVEMEVIKDNIFGVYMLAVAVTAFLTGGYFWGILCSFLSVITMNYFFTFPYLALNFSLAGYPVTFGLMLIMSGLTSGLTARVKKSAVLSAMREHRAEHLNEMSNAFLTANTLDKILDITVEYFYITNQCSVVAYLDSPDAPRMKVFKTLYAEDEAIFNSPLERQVALDAYMSDHICGVINEPKTQNCKGTYIPISSGNKVYGVIGLIFENPDIILEDTFKFSGIMVSQTIFALERQAMEEKTQKIILEQEKEKMRANLLRAVSHDLRTPLTSILGSSAAIMENKELLGEETTMQLLSDINHDAQWLINMVENLLSVTKINSDGVTVKTQDEIVEEVVAEAVSRVKKRYPDCIIAPQVPDEMLLMPMDATLIEQVLINLMENAIRHSESRLPVSVSVRRKKDSVYFTVADHGKGLPEDQLDTIFDGKSILHSADATRGLGIGLTICKTIIMAHKGKIYAKNAPEGGAEFTFLLPMKGELDDDSQD